jgi:integrase
MRSVVVLHRSAPVNATTSSKRLNWQRVEIGRITRVSGARNTRELQACHTLLDKLYRSNHLDVLRALRDGELSMRELRELERDGLLDFNHPQLGDRLALYRPLWSEVERVLPQMGRTESTRKRYMLSFRQLRTRAGTLQGNPTLQALDTLDWRRLERNWPGGPADWNRLRACISRFLTLALGSLHHPLRVSVLKQMARHHEEPHIGLLTLPMLAATLEVLQPNLRPAILTLAFTGLRVGELYAVSQPYLHPDRGVIQVPRVTDDDRRKGRVHPDAATKTRGRLVPVATQLWPIVHAAIPVPVRYRRLAEAFRRASKHATGRAAHLHELRNLPAQELGDRGHSVAVIRRVLGHKTSTIAMQYADRPQEQQTAAALASIFAPLASIIHGDTHSE